MTSSYFIVIYFYKTTIKIIFTTFKRRLVYYTIINKFLLFAYQNVHNTEGWGRTDLAVWKGSETRDVVRVGG